MKRKKEKDVRLVMLLVQIKEGFFVIIIGKVISVVKVDSYRRFSDEFCVVNVISLCTLSDCWFHKIIASVVMTCYEIIKERFAIRFSIGSCVTFPIERRHARVV